jgi:hypothetical protein
MPVDSDESQCSVCGEIIRSGRERFAKPGASQNTAEDNMPSSADLFHAPKLELTPQMMKFGIVWMVLCAAFSILCISYAFYDYSIEAMWASFIAAGLAGLPLLYVILGRTVEVAYWFRKELTIVTGIAGVIFCIYLLAQAILKSNIQVETAGMQEMATNENFTKTLITGIICITLIAVMIPVARMLLKSSTVKTFTNRYEIDSRQDMHTRSSENTTSLELRKLELAHEVELRKLELEREKLQMESERLNLLTHNSQLLIAQQQSGEQQPGQAGGASPPLPPTPPPPPPTP